MRDKSVETLPLNGPFLHSGHTYSLSPKINVVFWTLKSFFTSDNIDLGGEGIYGVWKEWSNKWIKCLIKEPVLNKCVNYFCPDCSPRGKRFRVVSEQRKTEEQRGKGSVLAAQKMERDPLLALLLVPFFEQSLTSSIGCTGYSWFLKWNIISLKWNKLTPMTS